MKKKANKAYKKEDYSEEWCFVCKDGGDLIICDHKDCLKSYHPECAQSSANSKRRFICDLHKCDICDRTSDLVHCYCCPKGVCRRCIKSADFVHVKGKKGFCNHCLKLALLVEEKKDVDSDGETIDFNNRNTYETLYKEYWEIINNTEKLTLDVLIAAKGQLKSGKNYDSDKYDDHSDDNQCSDYEEKGDDMELHESAKKTKRSKPESSSKTKGKSKAKEKEKMKPNKEEFMGWGSTRLIQFLENIGKDTTNALSQRELEKIVKGYGKEKDLIQKNKIIECDVWLRSIFKRKTIKLNRIYDSLETHLAENQVSSDDDDDDELGLDDDDMDCKEEEVVASKRKKKNNGDKLIEKEEPAVDITCFRFASIVPENIRLVYLRRSLVQKLEKEPESFESKVIGSFVRVKEDANGFFLRNAYRLMQVTGVKKCLVGESEQTFMLQSLETDICINLLSDDEFTEEECQDLKNKVKSGLLKKLEVVEVEEKARSLHKDIVTHWIPRELALLKHRIDQANEKGWRKELHEYLERRQFLQTPENQTKLLEKIPTVIPDIEEAEPLEDDKKDNKDSPKSILIHSSSGKFKDIGITSEDSKQEMPASEKYAMAVKLQKFFENKPKKPFIVKKPTQLFDSSDEKSTVDIRKEDLEDIKSSQWYVMSPCGDKVGPVSLSVLKNWSQTRVALESKIYNSSQTEDQAKPLTDVLHLAFDGK
ncbi:uncharacterized protein At5g08430 isoform X1 [Lactuca sativa]|uniref:uncharacterized protein At5g08430 isoform X1 n=1 Tax=Lactuca sativa TaxID=4236 RepID=UPI000CD9A288|nr:uncharacterized protein At5g08430 isoform X1 [Lactuca sativa]